MAKQFSQDMQAESNFGLQQVGTLLYELLVCATTTIPLETRQTWRKYTATIAEYIRISYNEIEKGQKRPWWQQLYHYKSDYSEDKQVILNLYWWLQIVMAREEAKLPAWEGIRIVREREPL